MGKHSVLIMVMGLLALYTNAQTHISGTVTDSASRAPLPYASVYVVNTTVGTQTNDKGIYELSNLPAGNHQVIVSLVGYGTKLAEINTTNKAATADIALTPKVTELKEVKIDQNGWRHNLNLFKNQFIGTTNPAECVIRNEGILDLDFSDDRLTAKTSDFLDIDNHVLGYKLRFLVKDFFADFNTRRCHYLGSVIFEPLHGTKADEKKWAKNRLAVYNASFRHLLVSASQKQLGTDQFITRKMTRQPNPKRPADSIIKLRYNQIAAQLRKHHTRKLDDSLQKWSKLSRLPKIESLLSRNSLTAADIVTPGTVPGTFNLQISDYIYVIYKKKTVQQDFDGLFRFPEARDYQIASVSLKDVNSPTVFNSRGILISKESLYYEGAWSSRIIDLLPDDYEPPQK